MRKKRVLSVKECAEELGVHRNTVYKLIAAGDLPAVRLGDRPHSRLVVVDAELDAWLARKSGKGAA